MWQHISRGEAGGDPVVEAADDRWPQQLSWKGRQAGCVCQLWWDPQTAAAAG
jgi:hypothetical protein